MYKYFYEWWNEINNTIWPFSVPHINISIYTNLHQPIFHHAALNDSVATSDKGKTREKI